jgi:hypothetical protein
VTNHCSGIDLVRLEQPKALVFHHAGFKCPSCKRLMYSCCVSYCQEDYEDSRVYTLAMACSKCDCYWVEVVDP